MISPTYTGTIYDPTASSTTTTEATGIETGMGQDAFLKMFMAQMTNQNPLDPMDNTEFTAQLATFSQLEQLISINESMESLNKLDETMQQAQASDYIGKEVTLAGNLMPVVDGYVGDATFTIEEPANVTVRIYNENGSLVAEEDMGKLAAGQHLVDWDGQDYNGDQVADGLYRVSVTAIDSEDNTVEVSDQTVSGLVTGYQADEDGTYYLVMGSGALPLSDVLSVSQPANNNKAAVQEALDEVQDSTADAGDETSLSDVLKTLGSIAGLVALI